MQGVFLLRRCGPGGRSGGLCAIFLGVGILLSMVLPTGVIIFVGAVALIVLGVTWMRKP